MIERTEFTPYIEENQRKIEQNKEVYKKRQSIVEHPYGTIKRQWGFYYILSKKGMARASADVGLMLTAYNLKRLINILGIESFRNTLLINILRLLSFFGLIRTTISRIFTVTAIVDFPGKTDKNLLFTSIFGKN